MIRESRDMAFTLMGGWRPNAVSGTCTVVSDVRSKFLSRLLRTRLIHSWYGIPSNHHFISCLYSALNQFQTYLYITPHPEHLRGTDPKACQLASKTHLRWQPLVYCPAAALTYLARSSSARNLCPGVIPSYRRIASPYTGSERSKPRLRPAAVTLAVWAAAWIMLAVW